MSARVSPPPGPVPPALPSPGTNLGTNPGTNPGTPGLATGTVPDAPPAVLRLANGAVIAGIVIGRDARGRITVKTGLGLLPLSVETPLPVGSRVSLEIRRAGGRLLAIVLAAEPPPEAGGPGIRPSERLRAPVPSLPETQQSAPPRSAPPQSAAPQPVPPQPVPARPAVAGGSLVTAVVVRTASAAFPDDRAPAPGAARPLPAGTELTLRIVEILPPTAGRAGAAQPPSAATLTGTVEGATPAGQPVVETDRGRLVLSLESPPVQTGSRVVMEVVAPPPSAPAPAAAALPDLAFSWDRTALAEAVALLAGRGEPGGERMPAPPLPRTGPRLAAALLAVLAALRGGDVQSWLDAALGKPLERAGHDELATRIRQEFAQITRLAAEATEGQDWRLFVLPLLHGTAIENARLHLRRRRRERDRADGPEDGARFVFEVELTRLGPLQLDGLVRARRFDLMLRSRRPLPARMRRDITDIFDEARAIGGLAGRIEFATAEALPTVPLGRSRRGDGVVV